MAPSTRSTRSAAESSRRNDNAAENVTEEIPFGGDAAAGPASPREEGNTAREQDLKDMIVTLRQEMAAMMVKVEALETERTAGGATGGDTPMPTVERLPAETEQEQAEHPEKDGGVPLRTPGTQDRARKHHGTGSPWTPIKRESEEQELEFPDASEPLFDGEGEEHDLRGLELKLHSSDYLRGSENWEDWITILISALESTGWQRSQPLSISGEGKLTVAIVTNVTDKVKKTILRVAKGSSRLHLLQKAHATPSYLRKDAAIAKFTNIKLEKGGDVTDFIHNFELVVAEYRAYEQLSDDTVVRRFLQAVEESTKTWFTHMRHQMRWHKVPSPQELYNSLLEDTQQQKQKSEARSASGKKQSHSAHEDRTGQSQRGADQRPVANRDILCWKCGKRGHMSKDCWGKRNPKLVSEQKKMDSDAKRNTPGGSRTDGQSSQTAASPGAFYGAAGHDVLERLRRRQPKGGQTNFCFSTSASMRNEWLWDTGSDLHITNDIADISRMTLTEVPEGTCPISTGGGVIQPTHAGSASIAFTAPDGRGKRICQLRTVVVIPSMPVKIISGERFLFSGGTLNGSTLVLSTGEELTEMNIKRRGCLLWRHGTPEPCRPQSAATHRISSGTDEAEELRWALEQTVESGGERKLSEEATRLLVLWHRRLAHCSADRLKWTIKRTTGIDLDEQIITNLPCEACDEAKITKISSHDSFKPATYAGEKIHFDLGAISPTSIDGNRYFEMRTDLFSRYRDITFHKNKSDVVDSMKAAVVQRNSQLSEQKPPAKRRVKTVHIDGARELTSEGVSSTLSNFERFCRDESVELTISSPQNHHQNPYSERGIRVLQDAARAMSIQMRIPSVFWDLILKAAAYLTNRTATSSLQGELPVQVFRKSMEELDDYPTVSMEHVRVIGSLCTVYVERTERVTAEKLEPRGVKAVLLGFAGEHNYLVWLIDGGRFLRTPNVVFRESVAEGVASGSGIPTTPDPRDVVRSLPPAVQRRLRHRAKPRSSIKTKDLNVVEEDVTDSEEGRPRPKRGRPKRKPGQVYYCEAPIDEDAVVQSCYITNPYPTLNLGLSSNDRTPSLRQAMEGTEWSSWQKSMHAEIRQLLDRGTFEFVVDVRPQNVVSAKWVLLKKLNPRGEVEKYKARVVARGFTQREGIDFIDTTATTARSASWRMLVAVASMNDWPLIQTDFVGAYLAGDLDETIYMHQFEQLDEFFDTEPEMATRHGYTKYGLIRLRRPLYGLKQSGANWQRKVRSLLEAQGIKPLSSDDALYQSTHGGESMGPVSDRIFAASHVDDFLWTGPSRKRIGEVLAELRRHIDCSENDAEWFLGVRIVRSDGAIQLDHGPYAQRALSELGMEDCRPASVPVNPGVISAITDPQSPLNDKEEARPVGMREFLGANGKVMYTACIARPDLAFAASFWARFGNQATERHLQGVKQALRYLKGTGNLAITYRRDHQHPQHGKLGLHGAVDAAWGDDVGTSRSTSGYVFFLAGGPILWRSATQSTVAQSSTEAEHYAINEAVRDAAWIRKLLEEMDMMPEGPLLLTNDNNGALAWCKDSNLVTRRKRHVRIRFDCVKQEIDEHRVAVQYVPTQENSADVLTKGLDKTKHTRAVGQLGLEMVRKQVKAARL